MKDLTKRQKQIFDFIIKNINKIGFPPSINEIQTKFLFKSPNAVQDHLKLLEKKGYITRHPNKSRGIEILTQTNNINKNSVAIPIIGKVTAGMPILAQENFEGTLTVDRNIIKNLNNIFALKVKGDSMINAGILNGDLIVVHQQSSVDQGEITVVLIEDEATVKRFYREDNRIKLKAENESVKPIYIDPKEKSFQILGKVISVIRKV